MNIKQRMAEIKARLKELYSAVETASSEELDAIESEINDLKNERKDLEKRLNARNAAQRMLLTDDGDDYDADDADDDYDGDGVDADDDDGNSFVGNGKNARSVVMVAKSGMTPKEKRAAKLAEEKAKRAADYKKGTRTVVLDSNVLIPKHQSNVLTGYPFNQFSGIIDAVNYLPVITGETYEEPYVVDTGMADYTEQPHADGSGGMYHEVGISWDTAKIVKTKITAYSEVTKELEKTPAANYADAVEGNVTVSLKKKLAKEIVVGDGAEGHFTGIMSNAVKENAVNDYNLGEINENTLDELILNYGGDEDIESKMAIIINKLTLLAFSRVRGTDKRKVYTINYENNTIDGIKFFPTSSVKSFDAAATGDAIMAYGDLNKYRVAVFSNIETARSEHYKFRQGITAFRGDVFMGGNIIGYKAFTRVFKAASSVKTLTKKTAATT